MAGEDKAELPEGESAEAERRFNETLKRLANTPHKPHKPKEGREPKPAPKR